MELTMLICGKDKKKILENSQKRLDIDDDDDEYNALLSIGCGKVDLRRKLWKTIIECKTTKRR